MKDTHTPPVSIRVPKALWAAVKVKAAVEGRTATDVVVAYLERYVSRPAKADERRW